MRAQETIVWTNQMQCWLGSKGDAPSSTPHLSPPSLSRFSLALSLSPPSSPPLSSFHTPKPYNLFEHLIKNALCVGGGREGGALFEPAATASLIPANKEKWTEAGMGTWGGAGGQREEFISKSSQQRKVDRGRHGDLLRGWGWREELSNSIQQRKWKVERGRHGEDLGRG